MRNRNWTRIGLWGLAGLGVLAAGRGLAGFAAKRALKTVLTDKYPKNIWEVVTSISRTTPSVIVENALRAQAGTFIERPLGGPKKFPGFEGLMFNAAMLHTAPASGKVKVDTSVVIGPKAAKPLHLSIPIMNAGMGYGFSLSLPAKITLAKAATLAGTAANTGQGPLVPEEREAAKHLILQFSRGSWSRDPKTLRQADAIEMQFGHGANVGIGPFLPPDKVNARMRRLMQLKRGQGARVHNRMPELKRMSLAELTAWLKEAGDGVPVGIKLAAGKYLEEDLAIAVEAGVDFVALDGGDGGSKGSLPILEDEFGVPTFYAVCRAHRFWEQHRLRGRVSLIISGGLKTPGDFFKALALGADAVAIGTVALLAMSHTQSAKVLPFEPPTQLMWHAGNHKQQFNVEEGVKSLANFYKSTVKELEDATKALGKTAIRDVNRGDMFALDAHSAEVAGVPPGYLPPS